MGVKVIFSEVNLVSLLFWLLELEFGFLIVKEEKNFKFDKLKSIFLVFFIVDFINYKY